MITHATQVDIELEAVEPQDTVSGAPQQGVYELGTVGDTDVGIWELRDGVVTDTEVEEMFIVLSGGATIEFLDDAGDPQRTVSVTQGDVMRLAAGDRTRWSVPDHIRKVYIAP